MSNLPKVSVADLLDAGIHFGHKTSRWNPKMAPYIYGVRDKVHIIDLQQTVPMLDNALNQLQKIVSRGGRVLFVGTKRQAQDKIAESAKMMGLSSDVDMNVIFNNMTKMLGIMRNQIDKN